MNRAARLLRVLGLCALVLRPFSGTAGTGTLDRLDRSLHLEVPAANLRADLSGIFDLEAYAVDERPPALIFGGAGGFVNPRLRLFADVALGRRWYGFVQARADRGFDPRLDSSGAARFDEYLLRFTPFDSPLLHVQAGKFATVVGNWVARHDSWNNPLVNAPLPYENVTIASDLRLVPDADAFLARRSQPDRKRIWVPVLWGPSYASGASFFGELRTLDWAVEVKNASVSSRPSEWDGRRRDLGHPTVSTRLGWRPDPAWRLGASYSDGPWLAEVVERGLPPGRGLGDFRQRLVGADLAWAWRHVEVWGELFASRFEVPKAGDADSLAWYLEGRYRVASRTFVALRWNQQLFGTIDDGSGRARRWDRDAWRMDAGLSWRFDRHLQAKLQYAFTRESGGLQQGPQLVAGQLTLKF